MRLIYLNQFWGNGRWINQLSSLSDLTALKTYNFIWKNGRKNLKFIKCFRSKHYVLRDLKEGIGRIHTS